ncbi:hypothetical protein GCM10011578_044250 [Streptomyces fuscichromogenes]|uniref:Uncharacterized protein n=1 Tax=Streptomyces fuscichromogenes TaxID=1324013 RepID=A0A918CSR2_9ACTN|nr:hypothetical protein GCM10011578_044250 [Streptomyces fuscichromogenes]
MRLRGVRRRGCGCMHGPFAPRQPPVSGCTLSITLCRGGGGRALERPIVGCPAPPEPYGIRWRDSGHMKFAEGAEITGDRFPV